MASDSSSLPSEFSQLRLSNYHYKLPQERIAKFPLEQRDQAKLLCYKGGEISHQHFYQLPEILPSDAFLVFNNTRVVKARLYFRRETGALIEILLLSPSEPSDIQLALQRDAKVSWHCIVGNKKRWKDEEVLKMPLEIEGQSFQLRAGWADKEDNEVDFSWDTEVSFSQILEAIGKLPLPPYLNREATEKDLRTYQTVYAREEGAVAAPTAGRHFTERVFDNLAKAGIPHMDVTLHVGAGTFLPVKEERVVDHDMHEEQMVVELEALKRILGSDRRIIPVGTTAMRLLESIYILGVKILEKEIITCREPFDLGSYEAYVAPPFSLEAALGALIALMEKEGRNRWVGSTRIYILPGYKFRLCKGLITNFHMPETTLMLLVAALVGNNWKKIYEEALDKDYRFLSYGDSSLLLP